MREISVTKEFLGRWREKGDRCPEEAVNANTEMEPGAANPDKGLGLMREDAQGPGKENLQRSRLGFSKDG